MIHVEAEKSFNFLGDEYDDLNASCKDTKQLISRLSRLSEKAELLAKQIDEAQKYTYSFNVKLLGIPDLKPRESAMETIELVYVSLMPKEQIRLFEILTLPIEFHRETPPAGALNVSSESLFDAFLRSLTCNEEVKLRRYILKIKE